MPLETSITTPITGTSPEAVISTLHNHDTFIRLTSVQLLSYRPVSGAATLGTAAVYEVQDRRPFGDVTVTLTLTSVPNGLDALNVAKPPTGGTVTVKSEWRVVGDRLEEHVAIDAGLLIKKNIKSGIEKNHPAQHKSIIDASI
ncbi:hypothetical protein BX600DRAFT_460139 [Xylariales sp. PMI_506]|nr:hypothetical protein BX600DRAFT_460139 [Xylariales sp. PMI_506]